MAAYLGGVVIACFVVRAIVQKATQLIDAKLACNVIDHAGRDIVEVFKEPSQEPRRTELNRKTQPAMITAMEIDNDPVPVIQMEIAVQLLLRGFSGEATVSPPLFVAQETDRQMTLISRGKRGRCCKTYQIRTGDATLSFGNWTVWRDLHAT